MNLRKDHSLILGMKIGMGVASILVVLQFASVTHPGFRDEFAVAAFNNM